MAKVLFVVSFPSSTSEEGYNEEKTEEQKEEIVDKDDVATTEDWLSTDDDTENEFASAASKLEEDKLKENSSLGETSEVKENETEEAGLAHGLNGKNADFDEVGKNRKSTDTCADSYDDAKTEEEPLTADGTSAEECTEKVVPQFVRLISKGVSLIEKVKSTLAALKITGVQWNLTEDNNYVCMFIAGAGEQCEEILERLSQHNIGVIQGSSVSVFPASVSLSEEPEAENNNMEKQLEIEHNLAMKVNEFKKSIKSRLVVAQVVESVTSDALFTFDFLMLLVLASLVALMGLVEASSVVLVASMLISPLMGPILAGVFGTVIKNTDLLTLGWKSEVKGLGLCILVGFVSGFIPAALESSNSSWRSSETWPTDEMSSRGALRSLPVGILIAIPSGAGVALSILGGKIGSLVGVAISASLLPPAVNAGLLWANAIVVALSPPPIQSRTIIPNSASVLNSYVAAQSENISSIHHPNAESGWECPDLINNDYRKHYSCNMAVESVVLGCVSLLLTILNIICIIIMGIIVLKITEVAPMSRLSQNVENDFFGKDLKIARESYQTTKGQSSILLGKRFLEEYKKVKTDLGCVHEEEEDNFEFRKLFQDVEDSAQEIVDRIPHRPKRWTIHTGTSERSKELEEIYTTVHFDNFRIHSAQESSQDNVRLRHEPQGPRSAEPILERERPASSTHFTIHRYIPPSELYQNPLPGRFLTKLQIPRTSRFQIAKVKEDLPSIKEQESTPLL